MSERIVADSFVYKVAEVSFKLLAKQNTPFNLA